VQVFQSVTKLGCPGKDIFLREKGTFTASMIHEQLQILTWDKIHHKVITLIFGKEVRYFREIWVIKARKDRGLTIELLMSLFSHFLGEAFVLVHLLKRTKTSGETVIFGKVD
jgi:hypothetical protein